MKVNNQLMEINKPSELSQILFVGNSNGENYDLVKISPGQIDMINCIYYYAREKIVRDKLDVGIDGVTVVDIPLNNFNSVLDKYKGNQYDKIIDDLHSISNIRIVVNSLGKNKDEETMLVTRFILEMEISKHRTNLHKKKVSLLLSNKLIRKFIDVKKYFAKMFLNIQFSMNSKYSKLLYELLKDYESIKSINIELLRLVCLLNDVQFKEWSIFRANVLERAITEINEKSDILVSYEPIKEKLEGQRKQVTKIKFNIEKQPESRLQELGLIQQSIQSHKFYNKSKAKLDNLVQNGYRVIDPDMWIETDIKKNEQRYDAEMRIDTWLRETEPEHKNMIYAYLASNIEDCEDPMVVIDDYVIRGLFSRDAFTKNAAETIAMMNEAVVATE